MRVAIESNEPGGDVVRRTKDNLEVRRKVRAMVDGFGLQVQELKAESVISNPMEPELGRIRVEYSDRFVSLEKISWEFLGNLEGYEDEEDAAGSGIGASEILRALGKAEIRRINQDPPER
jgi:hypothetical protein